MMLYTLSKHHMTYKVNPWQRQIQSYLIVGSSLNPKYPTWPKTQQSKTTVTYEMTAVNEQGWTSLSDDRWQWTKTTWSSNNLRIKEI